MQVTETTTNGLKRELKVVIPAGDIGARFATELNTIKDTVQLKGFRKGKVPVAHLKRMYGRSLMLDVLQKTVEETSREAIVQRKERPAGAPNIALPEDKEKIEQVLAGQSDLTYDMSFEVLPEIKLAELSSLKLERLVADIEPEALDKAMTALADRATTYEPKTDHAAAKGDRITMDFEGSIDGVPFEGGKGEGIPLMIGEGGFIPGFEDGLMGAKSGEARSVTAKFPDDYQAEHLKGKTANFAVGVKEVAVPKKPAQDDELAKFFGLENYDQLKERVTEQIKQSDAQVARVKLKRQMLDQLDAAHAFELPPSLVEGEFEQIWKQVNDGLKDSGKTFADEGKTEESAKAEYRKIAERRVRLGLVIGEIGDKNKIEVSGEELRRALMTEARRFPGQEKSVYDYFEKTPGAIQSLRAPLYEDKVVDFICELSKPVERKVPREELLKQDDED